MGKPLTDAERAANYRELHKMHPGNRFRLMFGLPLLPESQPTKPMCQPDNDEPPIATEAEIIAAMKELGGGFVKALAEAYLRGDHNNRFTIRSAFREYWDKYAAMAILSRKPGTDEEETE